MIGSYEVYQSFEDIWLDQIPAHWKSVKIKNLFHERVEKGHPTEPLLAATQTMGVVPKSLYGTRTVTAEKDLHLLKFVCVGDFVISLRSFQGGIEYAYYQGIISPAYTIMVPTQSIYPPYFRYLAKSFHFLELLKLCVTGIREGQNIDYAKLKNSFIPLPPQEEQEQIVRYLDSKISRIHHLISLKKQEIALLQEMKQAVISHAVTKGLNPKGNGVVWPMVKLGNVAKISSGGTPSRNNVEYWENGKIPWVKISDIYGKYVNTTEEHITENGLNNSHAQIFPKGTLLYTIFATVGEVSILNIDAATNQAIAGIQLNDMVKTDYAYYFLLSLEHVIQNAGRGTAQNNINQAILKNIKIPLPPLMEQVQIVRHLDSTISRINHLIENENRFIDRLNEYKTRLISDVVTGKIDVRTILVADPLPEENFNPDEPEIEAEIPGDNE